MAGWTSVLIRTERGRLAFEKARTKLDVRGLDDPDALVRLDNLDKRIAFRSLERALRPRRARSSSTTRTTCATTPAPTAGRW